MPTIITLTTDFGLSDTYVAAMKGVVLGINSQAVLVDVCHTVQPQNVLQAAFLLGTVCGYFPPQTVHVIVVDPGVGTSRRALLLVTPQGQFLAPDNGVLSWVLPDQEGHASWLRAGVRQPPVREVAVPEGMAAYSLDRPQWWCHPVSGTFHGRDIFAPVAAHLSLGVPPEELGQRVPRITAFPIPRPERPAPDRLVGHVLHVDSFGNLITDIREADLPQRALRFEIKGAAIKGLSAVYAEGGDLVAVIGSNGYLEIAARNGSAAGRLGAGIGDQVTVTQEVA